MVDSTINTPEISVGLVYEPTNNLVTQPMFTPSKVGGFCANISPLPVIAQICPICATSLTFMLQLYANVNEHPADLHRLIYVFACLSDKCIGTPHSIRAFRETMHDKNKFCKIMTDDEFDKVADLTDLDLETTKYADVIA